MTCQIYCVFRWFIRCEICGATGRGPLFALICVATGVAAVVALRSLAFMVGDELTTNLAQINRGDIRVYASSERAGTGRHWMVRAARFSRKKRLI